MKNGDMPVCMVINESCDIGDQTLVADVGGGTRIDKWALVFGRLKGGSRLAQPFYRGIDDAHQKENAENGGYLPWSANASFDEPPVVDYSGDRGHVDEAMETLPGLASHGPHDEGGRGSSEREEDDPGEEADLNEAALADVVQDGGPDLFPLVDGYGWVPGADAAQDGGEIIAGEEEDVRREMQRGVKEGIKADETTEANKPRDTW